SEWTRARMVAWIPVLNVLLALTLVAVLGGYLFPNEGFDFSNWKFLLTIAGVALFVGFLIRKIYRRLGYAALTAAKARIWIENLGKSIRKGKEKYAGIVLVRCKDDFWREAISTAIENADAVVIDVSDPSQNVLWELKEALGRLPPESILL